MEKDINNSLEVSMISVSSGAGFFFVERKDTTLKPLIDYQGHNDITVKNCLILPAFNLLERGTIFTKLNHCRSEGENRWKTALKHAHWAL